MSVLAYMEIGLHSQRDDALLNALERMGALAAESRTVFRTPDADQWRRLSLMRWEMLQLLTGFVDRSLVLSNCPGYRQLYGELHIKSRDFLTTYRAFVEQWSLRSQASIEAGYRDGAELITKLLETELALYQSALRSI